MRLWPCCAAAKMCGSSKNERHAQKVIENESGGLAVAELLTAAQMRAIEKKAIESGEVTGLELMERAGQGVVDAIFEEWPELAEPGQGGADTHLTAPKSLHRVSTEKKTAVVLCGPGNNGGDGFVVARLLLERGWNLQVYLFGDPAKLPPDALANYERWSGLGAVAPLAGFDAKAWSPQVVGNNVWIIDALFGTGLVRPIEGALAEVLEPLVGMELGERGPVVSIDIASGICADSGRALGLALPSELAVSFHLPKCGHHLGTAGNGGVSLKVASIGLPYTDPDHEHSQVLLDEEAGGGSARAGCSKERTPQNVPSHHKYSHGHALILTGGSGKTGAARLAARGALRIGAGLVTLGVPPSAQMEVASQITAIMLQRVDGAEGLEEVLQDARLNALCLGPGMGLKRAWELVPVALAAKRATVLDADALSAFADAPEALFAQLHENCVLTPHGGEFARLFPDIADKLNETPTRGPAYSKVDATRAAAKRAGCVVLFKGPDTVIADPMGRCSINSAHYERSAPWLATAGSGDVLAGFIAGLLARGFDPIQAAETAAWLHVECARAFGPGLIAEDLPEQIPRVFAELDL